LSALQFENPLSKKSLTSEYYSPQSVDLVELSVETFLRFPEGVQLQRNFSGKIESNPTVVECKIRSHGA
jgi:hypothetical protein